MSLYKRFAEILDHSVVIAEDMLQLKGFKFNSAQAYVLKVKLLRLERLIDRFTEEQKSEV